MSIELSCAAVLSLLSLLLLVAPLLLVSPRQPLGELVLKPTLLEQALLDEWQSALAAQRTRLEAALAHPLRPSPATFGAAFADVEVDLQLPPSLLEISGYDADITGQRAVAFAPLLQARGCLMYGAGIATDGKFEDFVASQIGCEVHGFDCTLTGSELAAARARYNFTIHSVCIGRLTNAIGGDYVRGKVGLQFVGLADAKRELGHGGRVLDVLKFDIEGGEWGLLESEVLLPGIPDSQLPKQLMFELHTEGANTAFVNPQAVKGKGRREVAALFLKLLSRGFRVASKIVNGGDDKCADFILVREPPSAEQVGVASRHRGSTHSPWD